MNSLLLIKTLACAINLLLLILVHYLPQPALPSLRSSPRGALEGGGGGVAGVLGLGAGEQVFDGEDLHAGEAVVREGFGGVEACFDGFLLHWTCGRLEGYEQGEVGFFALHIRFEHGYLAALHTATLDLHDYALGLAAVVVEEVDVAVYAGVRALLAVARGAGIDQSERPPLELVAVVEG